MRDLFDQPDTAADIAATDANCEALAHLSERELDAYFASLPGPVETRPAGRLDYSPFHQWTAAELDAIRRNRVAVDGRALARGEIVPLVTRRRR